MTTTARPMNGTKNENSDPERAANPFGAALATKGAGAIVGAAQIEATRAIAETQAAMVIAKQFPRDRIAAMDHILQEFTRQSLAEKAIYSFARGGSDISGPSIRAAEAIAQGWGNIQCGIRELEQRSGKSVVEAFAWDLETNFREVKVFEVPHVRHTRGGQYRLEDPRDIYEMVANNGARRLRACILAVIPGDVIEAAMQQADLTLRTKVEVTPERIASLVEKFAAIGVSRQALEAHIQRRIDKITPALMVRLGKIYNSIDDGMSVAGDWFDVTPATESAEGESRTATVADKIAQEAGKIGAKPSEAATLAQADGRIAHASHAAPAQDSSPPSEQPSQKVGDDAARRKELRAAIAKAWKDVSTDVMRTMLMREYAKNALPDLTTAQLEHLLASTPALREEYA